MSDVLEAELAPSGSLKTGWVDIGERNLFRYVWCFLFYLGFILPFGFMTYWTHTIAIGEFQKDFMEFLARDTGGIFMDLGR